MNYIYHNNDNFQFVSEDIDRCITVYNDDMMAVKVLFKNITAIPDIHEHHHQQLTYILEGKFTFFVDDESFNLKAGDVLLIEGGKRHGCISKEKNSLLLDVFTPIRREFL